MRVYSAGEAIGPAWEHTKALMWEDRRWGRLLKLGLVALGAELGSGYSSNFRNIGRHGVHSATFNAAITAIVLLGSVFTLAFFVLFLYLGSRLQLAQFDILVLRNPMVAPAWQRHGRHTWRWAGLKVVILLGTLLAMLPLLIPAIPIFVAFGHAARGASQGAGQAPFAHLGALFLLASEVFAIFLIAAMVIRFVTALVLPGVALEDLQFGDALRRGWQIFVSDVPAMLWFAVLQPVFLTLMGFLLGIGLLGAMLVLALPPGLLLFWLWHSMHAAGTAAWFLVGTLGAIVAVAIVAVTVCAYVATTGTLLMFGRAWSLYFLGGRYPLLGQYLEPGPAVPVWTPPPSLPRDEDDDGPGFPGDPALA